MTTPYEMIGGEATVRALTERFYALMDATVQFAGIRAMHPENLEESERKLFMFLSGWLGGPDLFVQEFGHPMLRRRHLPFAIGTSERDQWVACMLLAMEEVGIESTMRNRLLESFFNTADFMRNREG
ncbi:MAG: group II truncated hemoglobin [Rhodobacteraceae bacterium]|nr:group II truncated hemoglobin [Paracoccaceae bacterium]